DFIFKDGVGAMISVNITGLPAGLYDFRSFHYDNSNLGALTDNAFDLEVQDADGTALYTGMLWSTTGSNYRVHSEGSGPIQVAIRESAIGHRTRFNGLRIVRYAGFDVDAYDAPASETQTNFVRMTSPTMTGNSTNGTFSPSAVLNGVYVTATASGGFRDRGSTGALATDPLASVLRDF